MVHLHDKADDRPTRPASKAFVIILAIVDEEGGRLLFMERTQGNGASAPPFHGEVITRYFGETELACYRSNGS